MLGMNIVDPKSVRVFTLSFRTVNNNNVRAMKISAVGPKLALPNGRFTKFCLVKISLKIVGIAQLVQKLAGSWIGWGSDPDKARNFFSSPKTSKTFQVSTQPLIQWVLAFFHSDKAAGA